jgi:hypothetical protein
MVVPPELTKGPFTVVEAQQAGLTWKQLQGRSWRRLDGGLYVWAGLAHSQALVLDAVHRRLPVGAAFSGLTAAWLHGLDVPACDPVEATLPNARCISTLRGVRVRRASLPDSEVVHQGGLPATSPLRTVADVGRQLPLVEAVVTVDMALHRGLVRLVDLQERVAAHPPRKGIAQLRQTVELAEPAAESPMETRLRLLLVLAGLPRPQAQVSLHDERGRFLGRPDLYYPAQRLCLEYDGATHRESLIDDNRRQNRIVNAGFRLLRFTAADLRQRPDELVRQVREALRLPGRPPAGPAAPRFRRGG